MERKRAKPRQIILVEDDDVDAEAITRAFRAIGEAVKITRFVDGQAAIDALRGPLGRQLASEPYLILLDLNMPRMGGIAFLDELRHEPVLKRSIVFVLTTSNEDYDLSAAYKRRVAGYLPKAGQGIDYGALRELLEVYYQASEFPLT